MFNTLITTNKLIMHAPGEGAGAEAEKKNEEKKRGASQTSNQDNLITDNNQADAIATDVEESKKNINTAFKDLQNKINEFMSKIKESKTYTSVQNAFISFANAFIAIANKVLKLLKIKEIQPIKKQEKVTEFTNNNTLIIDGDLMKNSGQDQSQNKEVNQAASKIENVFFFKFELEKEKEAGNQEATKETVYCKASLADSNISLKEDITLGGAGKIKKNELSFTDMIITRCLDDKEKLSSNEKKVEVNNGVEEVIGKEVKKIFEEKSFKVEEGTLLVVGSNKSANVKANDLTKEQKELIYKAVSNNNKEVDNNSLPSTNIDNASNVQTGPKESERTVLK